MHGKGVLTYADGRRFEGLFINGIKQENKKEVKKEAKKETKKD